MEKENEKSRQIKSFEDLDIWKESLKLAVDIYSQLKNCKDYGIRDQVQRAVVSISSNIAEGFERQINKEFIQFLFIVKGSAGELRTQLYLLEELNIIEKSMADELIIRAKKISSMIYRLINVRKTDF